MHQTQRTASPATTATSAARRAITEFDRRLTPYQAALDAEADPQLVTKWINQAQAQKASTQQDLLATTTASQWPSPQSDHAHGLRGSAP